MGNCQPGQEEESQPNKQSTKKKPTKRGHHAVPPAKTTSQKVLEAARRGDLRRKSTGDGGGGGGAPPPLPKAPPIFRSTSGATYNYDPTLQFLKNRSYYSVQMTSKHTFTVDIRYQKLKRIGSGAYGIVCSAVDQVTGAKVAIKKVGDVFADLVDAKRILREIRILTHLSPHKNIVGLLDVMVGPAPVADFKDLYLVFELFDGDLDRAVGLPQLTAAHIQYFLYQLLKGMLFVHSAGIIHRDLKPPNILINSNNDLAICDFGLARGVDESTGPTSEEEEDQEGRAEYTEYVVTRWYRAPELLCGNSHYDDKIDVWSIGLIFAELLIGKTVLRGQNYLDQLRKSMALVGKPTGDGLLFIESPAARRAIQRMDFSPTGKVDTIFAGYHPLAVDLLKKMLAFDPRQRVTVAQALEHPYFTKLRSEMEVVSEPRCGQIFDASFEAAYPLDKEMPKRKMQSFFLEAVRSITSPDRPFHGGAPEAD